MVEGLYKNLKFEKLFDFLDKNFYAIYKIGILLKERKILIAKEKNFEKDFFECKFVGKSVKKVYDEIFNFLMEKFKKEGFYLIEKDDRFYRAIIFRFIKFCEKHENIKKFYVLFENDEYKMQKVMGELIDDFLRCDKCMHVVLMIEGFENGINLEFIGFHRI